jgi:Family of unknown function (DUF5946)
MFTEKIKLTQCFSCKALVPDIQGPVHKYMDSSPGCWRLYGDILSKEYSPDFYNQDIHRITVDTFAVQHPGKSERKAIQSVNLHLISLYCVYEKKLSGEEATEVLAHAVENKNIVDKFVWLEPPEFEKTKNVTDVLKATNREEHESLVRDWGGSVWQAWSEKHIKAIESFIIELGI